jgi:hypothetical protein
MKMFKRTETMTIKEFMARQEIKASGIKYKMIPLVAVPALYEMFKTDNAYAESIATQATDKITSKVADAMMDKVVHAFDPLIVLAQALAYPVAMVMLIGGALYIMIGSKEAGFKMIQRAGIGYILVQVMPLVMDLLVEVGKAI